MIGIFSLVVTPLSPAAADIVQSLGVAARALSKHL